MITLICINLSQGSTRTICTVWYSAFWGGWLIRAPKKILTQNFVFTVLFGHKLDPLDHWNHQNNFSNRVGKSTSICAIDLAVQHIYILNVCSCLKWIEPWQGSSPIHMSLNERDPIGNISIYVHYMRLWKSYYPGNVSLSSWHTERQIQYTNTKCLKNSTSQHMLYFLTAGGSRISNIYNMSIGHCPTKNTQIHNFSC